MNPEIAPPLPRAAREFEAHGRRGAAPPAPRGFTLIELLVVVFIIGIVISLATLAVGDNQQDRVEREAQRLQALLRLAADESVITARSIGVAFSANGYAFLEADEDGWTAMEDDPTFHPRQLPDFVQMDVVVDDEAADLASPREESDEGDEERSATPQIAFFPSTELTPFEITIHGEKSTPYWTIDAGLDGEITLAREE